MDASRKPLIVAFYSDAPRAGKSTSAKVIEHLARRDGGFPVDTLSFAHPIRRAARQVLPAHWSEEVVRDHLSGSLKDVPIGELGGKTGRDLLKVVGNTIRSKVRDDLWADRLLEEVEHLGTGGVVLIDDMRWPCEYERTRATGRAFLIRLVTTHRHTPTAYDMASGENVDGLLSDLPFDVEVPAKGLVPQGVLEGLIEEVWFERIVPRLLNGP